LIFVRKELDIVKNKEFSKLRKQDLLQLLLTQGREAKLAEEQISQLQQQCDTAQVTYERLTAKLDEKDQQLEKLKSRLNDKDGTISQTQETVERLKAKLDDKDRQLEKLKLRLDRKDETIQELREALGRSPELEEGTDRGRGITNEQANKAWLLRRP
jgi:chromosome segregation ATPase